MPSGSGPVSWGDVDRVAGLGARLGGGAGSVFARGGIHVASGIPGTTEARPAVGDRLACPVPPQNLSALKIIDFSQAQRPVRGSAPHAPSTVL